MTTPHTVDGYGPTSAGDLDRLLSAVSALAPEYDDGLSNHGPMVVAALSDLHASPDRIRAWVAAYERIVGAGDPPDERRTVYERTTARLVGAPAGDWRILTRHELTGLVGGPGTGAFHGLIRTAHAIALLEEADTPARRVELARALAYWHAYHWRPARPPSILVRPVTDILYSSCPPGPICGIRRLDAALRVASEEAPVPAGSAWPHLDELVAWVGTVVVDHDVDAIAYTHVLTAHAAAVFVASYASEHDVEVLGRSLLRCLVGLVRAYPPRRASSSVATVSRAAAADSDDEHVLKLAALGGAWSPARARLCAALDPSLERDSGAR